MLIIPEQYRGKGLVIDVYHANGKTHYSVMHEASKKAFKFAKRELNRIYPEWPIDGQHVVIDVASNDAAEHALCYILHKPPYLQALENLLNQSIDQTQPHS